MIEKKFDIRHIKTANILTSVMDRIRILHPSDFLNNIQKQLESLENLNRKYEKILTENARYHVKFYSSSFGSKMKEKEIDAVISHVKKYFDDHNDECQFTFSDIYANYEDDAPIWSSHLMGMKISPVEFQK